MAEEKKKKYIVKIHLQRNKKRYAVGAAVYLDMAVAEHLMDNGVVEIAGPAAEPLDDPLMTTAQKDDAKLYAALDSLEEGNKDHFTTSGLPQVSVIFEKTGQALSAEQRNAAWADYQLIKKAGE